MSGPYTFRQDLMFYFMIEGIFEATLNEYDCLVYHYKLIQNFFELKIRKNHF